MIYAKGTLYKLKQKTAIALLQETYRISVEFKKTLSFQIVHLMNQTMTLDVVDTKTMIITITIAGSILYKQSLVDMVLQLNNTNISISNAIYTFHYSRTGYFQFTFFFT